MNSSNKKRVLSVRLLGVIAAMTAVPAVAAPVYSDQQSELNLNVEAGAGLFHSDSSYAGPGTEDEASDWKEGYINLGLTGKRTLDNAGEIYAGVGVVSSGTFGDGDASGLTTGQERRTAKDASYLGWRSGSLIPALGDNGLDISFGQQSMVIGDGFIVNGDALNAGKGIGSDYNRGGAYYMAARKTFHNTVIARIGGEQGLRADLFRLDSDNVMFNQMTLTGANVEHISDTGTFAALYLKGKSTGEFASARRDGQKTASVRYQGNAGVENLFLSTELVRQVEGDNDQVAHAGYVEAGWTFADATWTPTLSYRYSSFDENYDPLFFGFNRGFGTWFQGEVAANYAGPFNTNADVHFVCLKGSAAENLNLGINQFTFKNHKSADGLANLEARELDIYAEYFPNDYVMVSPLLGWFNPEASADNGGSQLGSANRSFYAQLLFYVFY